MRKKEMKLRRAEERMSNGVSSIHLHKKKKSRCKQKEFVSEVDLDLFVEASPVRGQSPSPTPENLSKCPSSRKTLGGASGRDGNSVLKENKNNSTSKSAYKFKRGHP
jgi:hypothetical protein